MKTLHPIIIIIVSATFFAACGTTYQMTNMPPTTKPATLIDTAGMTMAAKIWASRIPNARFGKSEPSAPAPVHKMKPPIARTADLPDKFIISDQLKSRAAKELAEAIDGLNYLQKVVRAEKAHLVLGTYSASNLLDIDYDSRDSTLSINPNKINYLRINFGLTKKHPVIVNDFYYNLTIVIKGSSPMYELIWPDGMTITYMDKVIPLFNLQTDDYDRLEMEILRMVAVMTSVIYKETIEAGLQNTEIGD